MDKALAAGVARHAAQLVAGALLAYGVVDQTGVEVIVGAAVSLAALVSYLWSRRGK